MQNTTTCIVAFNDKVNRKLYIGGDSAGVAGLNLNVRKDPKVFKVGEMIMGFTSSFRMGQILMYKFKVPEQLPGTTNYEYMVTSFIDAVRSVFRENGYGTTEDKKDNVGGCFIVGYKGELYCIEDDFQVGMVPEPFMAVGCGQKIAEGALYALDYHTREEYSGEEKVLTALKAAEKYSGGVRGPFNIVEMSY